MERLKPFRGYRYNLKMVGDPADLVTQPYDKITPAMRDRYVARSPFNIAHVISNPDYEGAGRNFNDWIQEGILVQDSRPCLYPYSQRFNLNGKTRERFGLVGLVPLDDPDMVKGHERVLDAPMQDRLNLITQTESNDGLIFSLFSDPTLRFDQLLEDFCDQHTPVLETRDEYGVRHRLWKLTDQPMQQQLVGQMSASSIYIADGHHRYYTALRYADQCRAQGWKPAAVESFDHRMMALFNTESPLLRILPTHRAVHNLEDFSAEDLLQKLEENFHVKTISHGTIDSALKGPGQKLVIAQGSPVRYHLLTAGRQNHPLRDMKGVARELDVNLLHLGILDRYLGIGEKEVASGRYVDYYRDREGMLQQLEAGKYQLGFVLNPTRLSQVKRISEEGERMPQKSTDFYPKLLTGLVFMKMQIDR